MIIIEQLESGFMVEYFLPYGTFKYYSDTFDGELSICDVLIQSN